MKKLLAAVLVLSLMLGMCGVASARIGFYEDRNGQKYADFYYSNDDLMFSPELENFGSDLVNYIEIAVLCLDEDGDPIYPDDNDSGYIRYFDSSKGYAAGRAAPFGSCRMSGCKGATYVFCAVVSYRYRDGRTVECADTSKTNILEMYDWAGWRF